MQYYRCECGETESYGSMPPPACMGCDKCRSRLEWCPKARDTGGAADDRRVLVPREFGTPKPHEYTAHVEQMGTDGPVKVPVCRYCHRPQWEIEQAAFHTESGGIR